MSVGESARQDRDLNIAMDLVAGAMEAVPFGVAVRDGDVLLYTNPAWDRLTRCELAGVAGDRPSSVVSSSHTFECFGRRLLLTVAHGAAREQSVEGQLQEAQRLEALGRWVAGVVHDFNNLLTALTLYSDLVAQEAAPNSKVADYNEEIRRVLKRGAGLTGQLLSFVQQRDSDPIAFSLNPLLTGLRDVLERLIGEDVQLRLELAEHSCPVKIDPAKMQQVVFNLVLNARDAMPRGGMLIVRTSWQLASAGPVVKLEIIDTGEGIDAAIIDRVLEPFFTTKPKGKGTGLGLAVVRRVVEDAGGAIRITSAVGEGTTVRITLPSSEALPSRGTTSAIRTGDQKLLRTVLVVEDDAAVRNSIVTSLRAIGYKVLDAGNAPDAVALAGAGQTQFDLLLTDLVLPGMSGRELARRIAAHKKTIFISGYGIPADAPGAERVFVKPFDSGELAERVRQELESS